jgi:hypothetical protein
MRWHPCGAEAAIGRTLSYRPAMDTSCGGRTQLIQGGVQVLLPKDENSSRLNAASVWCSDDKREVLIGSLAMIKPIDKAKND